MSEAVINSPLGHIRIIARDGALSHLSFTDEALSAQELTDPVLIQTAAELAEYFGGDRRAFTIRIAQSGTPFQQRVWSELEKIPYGTTISYAELADRVGSPRAFRAVGGANGKNNVGIIVPCHRVITSDLRLGGYASGPEHKSFLLDLEKAEYKK